MSDEIRRGDVVVCIDSKPDTFDPKASLLIKGRLYRVGTTGTAGGIYRIAFHELPSDRPNCGWGFRATRFRKIEAPKTEVADRIRACRPVKTEQPA